MKTYVITAGGNKEPIDKVRSIVNSSRGTLGYYLAKALLDLSDTGKIYYFIGPDALDPPTDDRIETVSIMGANDLADKLPSLLREKKVNYVFHAMAVSDYSPVGVMTKEEVINNTSPIIMNKVSSNSDELYIRLKRNPKVIDLIKQASPSTGLLGFKLLYDVPEEELKEVGEKLLTRTGADYVFANDLYQIKQGKPHSGILISNDGSHQVVGGGKELLAARIIEAAIKTRIRKEENADEAKDNTSNPASVIDPTSLYLLLDRERERLGVSWYELSKIVKVSTSSFTQLHQGTNPDDVTLLHMCIWLGVNPADFGLEHHNESSDGQVV